MNKKVFLIGMAASIVFVAVFLNQLVIHIDKPLSDPDNLYQYFLIENNLLKITSFDLAHLYDTRMFHPLENTLALGNSQFIQSLLALPTYLVTHDVIVAAHSMVLINFFLAFLVMYILAFRLTKSIGASILGGLIFSYNPYVMAQFYFELLTIFWIPLIFLTTEVLIEKPSFFKGLTLPLLFLAQLISSFYYTLFMVLTWPVYVLIRLKLKKISIKKLINQGLMVGGVISVVLGFIYLKPYVETKAKFQVTRSLERIRVHSAKLVDFVSTSPDNRFYGQLLGTKFEGYTEHSLFAGFVVYGLVIVSLILLLRKKYPHQLNRVIIPFVAVGGIALVFSFGANSPPYLMLYKFMPFFDSLRAPSRFMVMGFFVYAILAAMAANYWLARLGARQGKLGSASWRIGIVLGLIFLISLEYQHNLAKPFIVKPEIKQAYQWLDGQDEIEVILELPIANELLSYPNLFRSYFDDSKYLVYALYHTKKLINGNAAFNPPERTALGQFLTINFPTQSKLDQLENMGADAVIVHREEYADAKTADETVRELRRFKLKETYTSNNIIVFTYE